MNKLFEIIKSMLVSTNSRHYEIRIDGWKQRFHLSIIDTKCLKFISTNIYNCLIWKKIFLLRLFWNLLYWYLIFPYRLPLI